MSRSHKRNKHQAIWRLDEEGGRIPIIRKTPDKDVSHSHDCWMCGAGRIAKRVMHIKPRRRREEREWRRDENC